MIPEKIRVKLVSEAAEYVSVTHVVHREFALHELVEVMVGVLGTDSGRIRQMLRVGTISNGEYRYRWEGFDIDAAELEPIIGALPQPEPSRPFNASGCFMARFRHGQESLDLPRDAASKKPLFGKHAFWDALLEFAAPDLAYADYSHQDRADRFTLELNAERWPRLHTI